MFSSRFSKNDVVFLTESVFQLICRLCTVAAYLVYLWRLGDRGLFSDGVYLVGASTKDVLSHHL